MGTRHISEWAISVALCGVVTLSAVDLYMMRKHHVAPHPGTVPETIGLHAAPDGEAVRVQWNHRGRPIVNADRAILYIADGASHRQVQLTGQQLDTASVLYWPESEKVSFRMEVYRGALHNSESTDSAMPPNRHQKQAGRAVVEKLRPSPFERVQPEIVVTQFRPPSVVQAREVEIEPQSGADEESSFSKVLNKIPLLRRLGHRESDRNERPQ